jgi:hypothetical protein
MNMTAQLAPVKRRPFRLLRALFCPLLGHRWLVYSGNTRRYCSHCRKEESRDQTAAWKD